MFDSIFLNWRCFPQSGPRHSNQPLPVWGHERIMVYGKMISEFMVPDVYANDPIEVPRGRQQRKILRQLRNASSAWDRNSGCTRVCYFGTQQQQTHLESECGAAGFSEFAYHSSSLSRHLRWSAPSRASPRGSPEADARDPNPRHAQQCSECHRGSDSPNKSHKTTAKRFFECAETARCPCRSSSGRPSGKMRPEPQSRLALGFRRFQARKLSSS